MWQAVTVDVLHMQRDHFGTRDASQLRRHTVTAEGDRTNGGRATKNSNLTRRNRRVEREDSVVSARAAIFYF
jgi:hypothetical protein